MRLVSTFVLRFLAISWMRIGEAADLTPAWTPESTSGPQLLAVDDATNNCTQHYCNSTDVTGPRYGACYCDDHCWQRRDCCLDFWQRQAWPTADDALDALSDGDRFDFWGHRTQCFTYKNETFLMKRDVYYNAVSSCPPITAPSDAALCKPSGPTDRLLQVPVYSHDTGVTYGNLCYAACNDDAANFTFWNATLQCKTKAPATVAEASVNRRCSLNLYVPTAPDGSPLISRCIHHSKFDARSECDPEWEVAGDPSATQRIRTLCLTVLAIVVVDDTEYANVFCTMCSGRDRALPAVQCQRPIIWMTKPKLPQSIANKQTKTFAVLFDVDFRSKGRILGVELKCPASGQLYDPFRQQCRQIFCSPGYDYRDGRCHPLVMNRDRPSTAATSPRLLARLDRSCPKVKLDVDDDDGVTVDINGTLTIGRTGERFEWGRYERDNDSVVVCADPWQNYVSKFPQSTFEVLTIAGSVLSLVALGLKMAIFFLLPETRTFPERIVLCLSASLFVAQLLFTVAVTDAVHYVLCATIAVVTHYAFLATFCWMTVLAFDVWQTFSNMEARNALHGRSKELKFLRYSLFGWTVPLVVVGVASACEWSAIQLAPFSPFRPYYGQALCWISGRPALLLYFVAPVGLLIGVNLVFFGLTSWNICASSRQTTVAQKAASADRRTTQIQRAHHLRFCLYLRLAVILGLTWVSGFVAAYADLPPLWYCFVALNTMQGVYLLLAFTSFRKVKHCMQRHLCRQTYGRMRGRRGAYENGHQPLQRSSTQSSQMTSVSGGSTQRTSVFSTMSVA